MTQIQSKDIQYFLTRQTANLREGFCQELTNNASLFLLYGESQVGKTHFLNEFVSTHLKHSKVHWIDFKGSAEPDTALELMSKVERILNLATTDSIIVADHFEMATNKLKHQILQSWATDGIDKKFSLIIATGIDGVGEISQLASQHRLDIKSFQLMPFTRTETNDYCASTLFPSLLPNSLSMSKQIHRALDETRGVVGMVKNVVEQQGDNISMEARPKTVSILKPLLVTASVAIVFVSIVLVYYFLPVDSVDQKSLNEPVDEQIVIARTDDSGTLSPVGISESDEVLTPKTVDVFLESEVVEQISAGAELVEVIDDSLVVQEQAQFIEVESNKAEIAIKEEPVKVEQVKVEGWTDVVGKMPYSSWFQLELKRSRNWLKSTDRSHGTIQIMTIGFSNATDDIYLNYVEALKNTDVDVSRLRVYSTQVRDYIVFSVVYGEYDSRRDARKSMPNLPLSLKANQPITRTIGGIWNEINTL